MTKTITKHKEQRKKKTLKASRNHDNARVVFLLNENVRINKQQREGEKKKKSEI